LSFENLNFEFVSDWPETGASPDIRISNLKVTHYVNAEEDEISKATKGKEKRSGFPGNTSTLATSDWQAVECGWLTSRQIEAARIAMTRFIKRTGRIWIRIFPDKPITKKPAETRMGKGKGAPEDWVAVIRPGRILYEMKGPRRKGQGGFPSRLS